MLLCRFREIIAVILIVFRVIGVIVLMRASEFLFICKDYYFIKREYFSVNNEMKSNLHKLHSNLHKLHSNLHKQHSDNIKFNEFDEIHIRITIFVC